MCFSACEKRRILVLVLYSTLHFDVSFWKEINNNCLLIYWRLLAPKWLPWCKSIIIYTLLIYILPIKSLTSLESILKCQVLSPCLISIAMFCLSVPKCSTIWVSISLYTCEGEHSLPVTQEQKHSPFADVCMVHLSFALRMDDFVFQNLLQTEDFVVKDMTSLKPYHELIVLSPLF